MDDVMGKIGEILSDEESMKQLSELAQMMMSGTEGGGAEGEVHSDGESSGEGPDLSAFMRIASMVGSINSSDKNSELLLALKPHLREDRQKKVDKAIKLLRLLALWNMAKENGLLSDIL